MLREATQLQENTTVNITDPDAHIMQQANGEKNPAYSITTAGDSKEDVIAQFQVNTEDHNSAALKPAIAGSTEKTGKAHEHTTADAGFGSIGNLEYLEEQNINARIPDRRLAVEQMGLTAKGSYDRSQFVYDAVTDSYRCPEGNNIKLLWDGNGKRQSFTAVCQPQRLQTLSAGKELYQRHAAGTYPG